MSRAPILVVGAGGFIGRRIVSALTATDWARPIAAGRSAPRADLGPGAGSLCLDIRDAVAIRAALPAVAGVVNCIAGSATDIVAAGRALLDAASLSGPSLRVVHLSSMAAYGSATGTVTETAPLLGNLGDYSAAKATVERLLGGLPSVVCLRPGIVYGPRSPWWSDRIARLLVSRRLGDLGPAGNGVCNLVHVDDVAAAVVRSFEVSGAAGNAFNLGSPEPPSWNGYFRLYAQALGTPPRAITPARQFTELKLYGPALWTADRLLRSANPWQSYPAIRPWLMSLCAHDIRLDVSSAGRVLGINWRSLEEGLAATAGWFLAGGRT